jgi:hypothetical protein
LLSPLDGIAGRLLGCLDEPVRHLAHVLVLDARGRDRETDDEADCRRTDGQTDRVALGRVLDPTDALTAGHSLGRGARDRIARAGELVLHRLLLVVDVVADAGGDVRLVAQRVDLVTDAAAGLL